MQNIKSYFPDMWTRDAGGNNKRTETSSAHKKDTTT